MRRLYIVVEGQTEAEFIESVLRPYLMSKGIYFIEPIIIHTSKGHKGGFVNYKHLFNDVTKILKQQADIIVSTFADFFRMPTNLPEYEDCQKKSNPDDKIDCLEAAINRSINDRRFLAYIQKYEFEALLFAANNGFENYYPTSISHKTQAIITAYPNPEEINNNPLTAPSKRLLSIIPDYEKVNDGNTIALEIGIEILLEKCPRFRNWVERMEKAVTII